MATTSAKSMSFHRCYICGTLFYNGRRVSYCKKCIQGHRYPNDRKLAGVRLSDLKRIQDRKARERARWHARMADPVFREKERIRSYMRYAMENKYAVKEGYENHK